MEKGSFFLNFHIRLLGFCFLCFSLVSGTRAECPLKINPPRLVVRYGGNASADCNSSVPHDGMGWEASVGAVPMNNNNLTTWRVSNLTDWNIEPPFCYINYNNGKQCQLDLPVTVYQPPDRVSIMTMNHTGPMTEGKQYELQCDVHNVAPVQNLTVRWYKGLNLVDQTTFTDTIKTPVSETATLLISPDRDDDGDQYRCEAELELGEEGPQPPPTVTSDPLSITVYYKPVINETNLPSIVHVVRGYPVTLVCEAEGNPKPSISWNLSEIRSETLTVTESTPENLCCTANNSVGIAVRTIRVVFIENYMPMILAIIFGVLVVISIIFIYIYCTYYKKNRMGHYNFRKPNAPNGLLAQLAQSP